MTSTAPHPPNNNHLKLNTLVDVKGKSVLFSHEPTEVGLLVARAFAVNGARVYIVGRRWDELKRLIETLGTDIAGSITPIEADPDSKASFIDIYDQFAAKEPHCDVLINDVGIVTVTPEPESNDNKDPLTSTSEKGNKPPEHDQATFRTQSARRCFFVTTGVRSMLSRAPETTSGGWVSTIINISSIDNPTNAEEHRAQCETSHAACNSLTRGIAKFIADKGDKIAVNGVCPSEPMSKPDDKAGPETDLPKDKSADEALAARQSYDQDIAAAVLFVASNRHLNGQVITVDCDFVSTAETSNQSHVHGPETETQTETKTETETGH